MRNYFYKRIKIIMMLFVVGVLFYSGCDLEQTSQATPEDAVRKFMNGYVRLNKAKVLSSVTGSKSEIEALSVYMDYMIALRDFKKSMIAEYGKSGWSYFEKEGGARLTLNMKPNGINLSTANIKMRKNKATFVFPEESVTLRLYLKESRWYVDAADVLETEGMSLRKFIAMWKSVTNVIKAKQQKIGQPDVTAQSLDVEMGAELSSVLIRSS